MIETKLEGLMTEAKALAIMLEKDMKNAALEALPITTKILSALTSPTALIVESLIPSGTTYATAAITAINDAIPILKVVSQIDTAGTPNTLAILQRLGAELTAIIHGGKHPFTFYIQAFEYVCFAIPQPTA